MSKLLINTIILISLANSLVDHGEGGSDHELAELRQRGPAGLGAECGGGEEREAAARHEHGHGDAAAEAQEGEDGDRVGQELQTRAASVDIIQEIIWWAC